MEFKLLAGAMLLLDLPDRELTVAEELALKDILDPRPLTAWCQAASVTTTSSLTVCLCGREPRPQGCLHAFLCGR